MPLMQFTKLVDFRVENIKCFFVQPAFLIYVSFEHLKTEQDVLIQTSRKPRQFTTKNADSGRSLCLIELSSLNQEQIARYLLNLRLKYYEFDRRTFD